MEMENSHRCFNGTDDRLLPAQSAGRPRTAFGSDEADIGLGTSFQDVLRDTFVSSGTE